MIPSVPNYDESASISTLGTIISLSSRKYDSTGSNEPSQVSLMGLLSPINLLELITSMFLMGPIHMLDLVTPTVLLGPMAPLSSMVPMSSSSTVGSMSIGSKMTFSCFHWVQ